MPPSQGPNPGARRILGFLRGIADDAEGYPFIEGILEVAQREGADLVYFGGGTTGFTGESQQYRNILFHMVGPHAVDALVVSGTISHHLQGAELAAFLDRYAPLPVVTIAVEAPGHDAVLCDNRKGMALVVDHLIEVHGARKLAFIGGPPGQSEAEDRLAAFLDSLARHGLEPRQEWIVHGTFGQESGAEACGRLLDAGLEKADALVCANDAMAMAAISVLSSAGMRVPEDIKVVGFDDHEMSVACEPPLTTASQHFDEEARLAASMALRAAEARMRGEAPDPPRREFILPTLVVRRSCGCRPERNETRQERLERLERAAREEAWRRYDEDLANRQLIKTGERLVNCHGMEELLDTFAREAPQVGLLEGWVSTFEPGDSPEGSAHLRLRWNRSGRLPLPIAEGDDAPGQSFRAADLLPGGLRQLHWTGELLSIQSFYSRGAPLGFALWSTTAERMSSSGPVRNHFGIALEQVRLLEELRRSQESMLRAEKMAALGNLVAGVAHEINTPLGVALSAASVVSARSKELRAALEGGSLKKSTLDEGLDALDRTGQLLESNLQRAANLVQSFKQVATDEGTLQRREFILGDYLNGLLLSIGPLWKHRKACVVLREGPQVVMDSYPGALAQALTQLVDNALFHGYERDQPGTVEIGWSIEGQDLAITVRDDGKGIAPEDMGRIFDPFFTTARSKGKSGLGLSVVYNLASQVLGGSLSCRSQSGRGAAFTLAIPRSAPCQAGRATND